MKRGLLILWTVVVAIAGLSSCQGPVMEQEEALKWISAYAPERVDMDYPIRIVPTDLMRKHLNTDKPLDKVFRFSPTVKGEAHYVDGGQYIDFIPRSGALKQDKEYTCRIDMATLTGVDSLCDFSFSFYVEKREMSIAVTKVRIDPNDVEQAIIEGRITFNTAPSENSFKSDMISCEKGATVRIIPTDDALCHQFRIFNLKRRVEDRSVRIAYKAAEGFCGSETEAQIPGLEEFKLLSAERYDTATPYIELEFSAPIASTQELDGLITIDGIDEVRIERSGTNVKVHYDRNGLTDLVLQVSDLLRRDDGCHLAQSVTQHFEQEVIPPAVEIPLDGTILPDSRNLTLPFRAVNLAAVDVEVVKIYADNVMMYLQENDLEDTYRLRRAGRLIYRQTVRLDDAPDRNLHEWQNFSIDLKNLFRQERGAIYNVRIAFRQAYSLYDRAVKNGELSFPLASGVTKEDNNEWDKGYSYLNRRAPDFDWDEYTWKEHDDPSKPTYYMDDNRMPEYNLAASNLGLIVKSADGSRLWTAVSDIMTAAPLAGVRVTAYNYQLQEIGHGTTDGNGFADFNVVNKPFIVTASNGVSTSYLKVMSGREKSLSNFDVGGKKNPQGIKGFVYGERGVWRPGDEVHLTLIVEDRQKALPTNHPVTMELYTPEERLYDRQTQTQSTDRFYVFHIQTSENAPTGRWNARFKVGGKTIDFPVKIETIKPNRIKIGIETDETLQAPGTAACSIDAHWLTGPIAGNLPAALEMVLYSNPKPFKEFGEYTFSNPLNTFSSEHIELSKGVLDSLGRMTKQIELDDKDYAPGMLQANIIARVREAGGDESFAARSVRYSPYRSYVGIRLGEKEFETDRDLSFPVVCVDAEGKLLGKRKIEYKIYKLNWNWWWEGDSRDLTRYVQSTAAEVVVSGTVESDGGKTRIPFRVDYPDWGKYLVFVRDPQSNHATGGVIFIDWPDWRGHAGKDDAKASSMLSFALDKRNYEAGETATVYLPKSDGGRVLLSVENASKVLFRRWVNTSADRETAYKIPVTREMAPNFYVHATLLQPHAKTNDLPIRMYGVEGAEVIDRYSILHPEIEVADEIRPQQEFSIKVRERDRKPMTYTLAIVDEGLLDITSFRTPQPWRAMNQREALGVKTWDIYDDVIGAYAGKFTKVLSVGGDEALRRAAGKEKRFNPVVKFLGPFTLKGGQATHKITLPMYVGSVRVMVVAAHEATYGHADKTVTVRSPLMVLPTLPRTLSCGDRVKLPINVFCMDEALRNATVKVAVEGPVAVVGSTSKSLTFATPSEQLTTFELVCDNVKSGQAKITVSAEGGGHTASETIYIDVRNPLPPVITTYVKTFRPGDEYDFTWAPFSDGTAQLEVAAMPKIDFSGAYSFVDSYAHYCTEQLSARAMYMLYARRFLSATEQLQAREALPKILKTILMRQTSDGGFAYWPGAEVNEWATSMAGEVMIEARRQGFSVADQYINRWKEYQQRMARAYKHRHEHGEDMVQAYRLYTLVKSGDEPVAAMNRLRESRFLSHQALMRLAAAYAEAGKVEVARQLIGRTDNSIMAVEAWFTFQSGLRDKAMELETWVLVEQYEKALKLAREIATEFSATNCTTQEVAFVSAAMNRVAGVFGDAATEVIIQPKEDKAVSLREIKGIYTMAVNPACGTLHAKNNGKQEVHFSLTTRRQPQANEQLPAVAEGIKFDIRYIGSDGEAVKPEHLTQGDEFYAEITVSKAAKDTQSLALSYAIPSGWEIWNERVMNDHTTKLGYYTDIRDDRIAWYFGLKVGESRTFKVRLRAAYCGRCLMPPTVCEDMYDTSCRAVSTSQFVEVVK